MNKHDFLLYIFHGQEKKLENNFGLTLAWCMTRQTAAKLHPAPWVEIAILSVFFAHSKRKLKHAWTKRNARDLHVVPTHRSQARLKEKERSKGPEKKSQRMKICINLMRFQEASGIFINSSAKDTQKVLLLFSQSSPFFGMEAKKKQNKKKRSNEIRELIEECLKVKKTKGASWRFDCVRGRGETLKASCQTLLFEVVER